MTGQFGVRAPGEAQILDEYKGMEVGDPGQPPLVPSTPKRGKAAAPSHPATRSSPERDLCMTRFALDTGQSIAVGTS